MGKQKKTRKFAVAKKIISAKDSRIKANQENAQKEAKAKANPENKINKVDATPTSLFFQYNTALGIINYV